MEYYLYFTSIARIPLSTVQFPPTECTFQIQYFLDPYSDREKSSLHQQNVSSRSRNIRKFSLHQRNVLFFLDLEKSRLRQQNVLSFQVTLRPEKSSLYQRNVISIKMEIQKIQFAPTGMNLQDLDLEPQKSSLHQRNVLSSMDKKILSIKIQIQKHLDCINRMYFLDLNLENIGCTNRNELPRSRSKTTKIQFAPTESMDKKFFLSRSRSRKIQFAPTKCTFFLDLEPKTSSLHQKNAFSIQI